MADLRGVVLDPDDVRAFRSFDILNAQVAAQHRFADFFRRAAELAFARFVAVFIRFAFVAFGNMGDVELEAAMTVVVDGHAPRQMIPVAFAEAENVWQAHAV